MYMSGQKHPQSTLRLGHRPKAHVDIAKKSTSRTVTWPGSATITVLLFLLAATTAPNTAIAAEVATKPVVGENGVISVGQDVMVTLVEGGRTAFNNDEMSLVLNLDALSQDLQDFIGGKSARVVAKIDCRDRQISTQSMVVFDQPHAAGAGRPKAVSSGFAKPPTGSYGADILETYCAKPMTVAEATQPAAPISRSSPQPAMLNVALSVPPATFVAPKAPTALKASPPVPAPGSAVAQGNVQHDRSGSSVAGGFIVQLVSSSSSVETDRILNRLRSELPFWPAGRSGYVAAAQVRGAAEYRGRLDGFQTRAQAAEFCNKVVATGERCVVFNASSEHKTN